MNRFHPGLPGIDLFELRDAVLTKLARMGQAGPGYCLSAAAVAMVELDRRGVRGVFQAGSACWRRVTEDEAWAAGEQDFCMFGYEYAPDGPVSQAALKAGQMPEFHAWVGVPPPGGPLGLIDSGWIVDFAAHHGPERSKAAGMAWTRPVPDCPLILGKDDMVLDRCPRTGRPSIRDQWYVVDPEATVLAALATRNNADAAAIDGDPATAPLVEWAALFTGDDYRSPAFLAELRKNERAVRWFSPLRALAAVRLELEAASSAEASARLNDLVVAGGGA